MFGKRSVDLNMYPSIITIMQLLKSCLELSPGVHKHLICDVSIAMSVTQTMVFVTFHIGVP